MKASEGAHHFLRKHIANAAIEGAKIKRLGRMCDSCAFKFDSVTNKEEPHNVQAAAESLAYYGQFNCHKRKGVDKGCPCIGFLHAKQFIESKEL